MQQRLVRAAPPLTQMRLFPCVVKARREAKGMPRTERHQDSEHVGLPRQPPVEADEAPALGLLIAYRAGTPCRAWRLHTAH